MSAKPKLAEVVTLYETNARDIPAMLREAANSIDAGLDVRSLTAVAIHGDGDVTIYGWGAADNFHSIAALHLGLARLTSYTVPGEE